MMRYFLFALIILSALWACQSDTKEIPWDESGTENFSDFYVKFHADSSFQMERIEFPLKGLPEFVDSATLANDYFYEKADWVLHKTMNLEDTDFKRTIQDLGPLKIERLLNQENIGIERRFQAKEGRWYLIYYVDMNQASGSEE